MSKIEKVEASAYTLPTETPETDATSAWHDTTLVLVQIWADGVLGTGWTYGSMGTAALIRQTLAPALLKRPVVDIGRLWGELVIGLRTIGRPGIGAMALSAVDCALWDLKARLLDLPLHHLLGAVRNEVPLYGSGGYVNYDDDQLAAQLEQWLRVDGLTRVKIKIGESWGSAEERDLARVRQTREIIGPDVRLYVDANGGYPVGQAVRIAPALDELDVRWFEEPVSSDDLPGLRQVRQRSRADITAGEYGYGLNYFQRMLAADAVDCLQVDMTRCGGITELIRVAALAAAYNLDVSGNSAPYQHLSALAAVPNLRHLEWSHDHVQLEQRFFAGTPAPVGGSLPVPDAPGHGLTWLPEVAGPYRVF